MAEDSRQKTEVRRQKTEGFEFGSRTRRRPIGRDYAAANDAEVGREKEEQRVSKSEVGMWKSEKNTRQEPVQPLSAEQVEEKIPSIKRGGQ